MQELEKILEEISKYVKVYKTPPFGREVEGTVELLERCRDIIRKHMNDGWISVEERLPPERGKYLCTAESLGYSYVIVGHYNNPGWMNDYCGQRVVAWQPLPEPYRPEI